MHSLFGLKNILEDSGYNVLTAQDGPQALKILEKQKNPPDLIISDIIMPKMNGYDFFKIISTNSQWNQIPFIFLTLISSPENVQWSRIFGESVDHIAKPFKDEELLAIIDQKLTRLKTKKLQETSQHPSSASSSHGEIILSFVKWDDRLGPYLKESFPASNNCPFSLEKINNQLFNALASIYGQEDIREPQGVLLTLPRIRRAAYIYFDNLINDDARSRMSPYLLSVLAPQISYSESEQIKTIFRKFSFTIKTGNKWNIENIWSEISNLLMPSLPSV